jgi:hypothetical protein
MLRRSFLTLFGAVPVAGPSLVGDRSSAGLVTLATDAADASIFPSNKVWGGREILSLLQGSEADPEPLIGAIMTTFRREGRHCDPNTWPHHIRARKSWSEAVKYNEVLRIKAIEAIEKGLSNDDRDAPIRSVLAKILKVRPDDIGGLWL